MIKFGIVGAMGRMGRAVASVAVKNEKVQLASVFEYPEHNDQGKEFADLVGMDIPVAKLETVSEEAFLGLHGIIDFSSPVSSIKTAGICATTGIPLVVGTTGYTPRQLNEMHSFAKEIPLLIASNMSLGVNLLFALTRAAARTLKESGFDPEIIEAHHRLKKDSPSGTATTLKEIILKEFGWSENETIYGRSGMVGERPKNELGVHALRGGDVTGEHTVNFFGDGEQIQLRHIATSRDIFARGAIVALLSLQECDKGLYDMQDILDLHF